MRVEVRPHGPIVLHGPVRVQDPDGNPIPVPEFKQPGIVKLCGCGKSANRPFCDGSHKAR